MEPSSYSDVLDRLHDDLILRQLSPHTVSSYLAHARLFLTWAARPVDALDAEDIRHFLVWFLRDHPVAPATVHVYSAAIRFLFAVTLNRSLNYLQIPRQKVPEALPVILSRSEVGALIAHGANLKHRAWLAMAGERNCCLADRLHRLLGDARDGARGQGAQGSLYPAVAGRLGGLTRLLARLSSC